MTKAQAAALRRASEKVRDWFDSRLADQAMDISRLYRAGRDRFTYRLRQVYDAYLADDPSLAKARSTMAGQAFDIAIEDEVQNLSRELGERSVNTLTGTLGLHHEIVNRHLQDVSGLSFRELPVSTQSVLRELTTAVVGGGTFMDRLFHQNEELRHDLYGAVRQNLLSGDDFFALRKRVHKIFGVDKLAEPKGAAYGSVRTYRNEALRQWNDLMGEQADGTGGTEIWYSRLDEDTTPGCAGRHGKLISEVGARPPRHYNCRCQVLVVKRGTDLTGLKDEGDAWLKAHGYTRKQAALEEADFSPQEHQRDDKGQFSSKGGGAAASPMDTADEDYKVAGPTVDGRQVRSDVPNMGSIDSELTDYEILPKIREVPFSAFKELVDKPRYYSPEERKQTQALAEKIRASGEINPLIVVIDHKGPYILEGGHRFDALRELGAKSFPAVVVVDREKTKTVETDIPLRQLFSIIKGRPPGFVIAAPHVDDGGTGTLVTMTAYKLGCSAVIARRASNPEEGQHRLNINRPTQGEDLAAGEERRTPEAVAVYDLYRRAVNVAAQGEPDLYVEIHSNDSPLTTDVIEVETVGISPTEATRLKGALQSQLGPTLPEAGWRVWPVEELIRWRAQAARRFGILRLMRRAVHVEIPEGVLQVLLSRKDARRAWVSTVETMAKLLLGREAEPSWGWGDSRLVPLYKADVKSNAAQFASVPWRDLPAVVSGLKSVHSKGLEDTLAAGGPDHVLLRGQAGVPQVLTQDGWKPFWGDKGRWIDVTAGMALDSTEAPEWERRSVRLPQELIQRWPAMRRFAFPYAPPGQGYAVRAVDRAEAEALTLGQGLDVTPWALDKDLGWAAELALRTRLLLNDPYLAVAIQGEPTWDVDRGDLRTIVQMSTGLALYARNAFPFGLTAPYKRVAVLAWEPATGDVEGPRTLWAIRPRGRAFWSLPGGHVDPGETPQEAAAREMREETGVRVQIFRSLGELYRPWATTEVFLAKRIARAGNPTHPEETDAISCVPLEHLADDERVWLSAFLNAGNGAPA